MMGPLLCDPLLSLPTFPVVLCFPFSSCDYIIKAKMKTRYTVSWPSWHSHTHPKQIAPCSLIITHSHPHQLSARCMTPKMQPEKKQTPTSLAYYSSPFVMSLRRTNLARFHWHLGLVELSPRAKQCRLLSGTLGVLTVLGGRTRWDLRYCDVLIFPKCADMKIRAPFESDVVIPTSCRCPNMFQCKHEEKCRNVCRHYHSLGV